jgi:tRNA(Ile)-lysidine synthase
VNTQLPHRLLEHIRESRLFTEPGLALLAVSGGADSVALWFLMSEIAGVLGLELAVAHADHGIAADSGKVAERVADLAAELGVPFHARRLQLGAAASETRARDARYAGLREMQREAGARYLVTAHQRDDQIETVLYRALRGSGMAGLAGIPATGPDGLIRPLLPFSRRELSEWLEQRPASCAPRPDVHRDPANIDVRHDRSWLRHDVIPLLVDRFGDDFARHMEALARHASGDRAAWAALLRALPELEFRVRAGVVEVARGPLRGYDKTLLQALLRALAREAGAVLSEERGSELLRLLNGSSGRWLPLGGGYVAEIAFEWLRIVPPHRPETPATAVVGEDISGACEWGGWRFAWKREPAGSLERASLTTWVTPGVATIRSPTNEDRVVPLGGIGHRKVRRLLMEARVPASERDAYPLFSRDSDVLWIPGVCRSAAGVPSEGVPAVRIDADTIAD